MKRLLFIIPVILIFMISLTSCGDDLPDTTEGEHTHEYEKNVVAPGCVEGYTVYSCKHCDHSYTDDYLPAVGHSYRESYTDTTCDKLQKKTLTCSVCGYSYDEESDKKGTKHNYLTQRIEATADKDAYILYTCTVCEHSYESHEIDENYYTVGLSYKNQGGKWYVSGLGSCKDAVIVIPSVNEKGNKVSGILEGAITGKHPVSVTVKNGVTEIGSKAITDCPNLTTLVLSKDAVWQTGTVYNCPSLTSLTVYYNNSTKNLYLHRIATASVEFARQYPDLYHDVFDMNRAYKGWEELVIGGSFNSGYLLDNLTCVKKLTVADGTTVLPSDAFNRLTGLESVTLPNGLKVIGEFSFSGLTKLTAITIPDSVETIERSAFQGCHQLGEIVFPKSLKTIGDSAFSGCKAITKLDLPSGLVTIEDYAFSGTKLTSVILPASVKTVGNSVFSGNEYLTTADLSKISGASLGTNLFQGCFLLKSVSFPKGITEIPGSTFLDCTGLDSITIPDGVTIIGNYAFSNCTALSSVVFNQNIVTVGKGAFKETAITSVTLPGTAQVIQDEAFSTCTKLKTVDLTKTKVTEIGDSAFFWCNNLSVIKLPDTVKTLGSKALSGSAIKDITLRAGMSLGEELFLNCTALESVTIENGVTALPDRLFKKCTALKEITVPRSVTDIGEEIFYGCTSMTIAKILATDIGDAKSMFNGASNLSTLVLSEGIDEIPSGFATDTKKLTTLAIPSTVKKIGVGAFSGSSIEKLILPKGITSLDTNAFSKNTRLTSVDFNRAEASLGGSVFSGCSALVEAKNYENLAKVSKTDISGTKLTVNEKGISHGLGIVFGYTDEISSNVVIPDGITVISASAFSGCKKMTSVKLPSTLKVIESTAFENCSGLTALDLPDNLTTIGTNAFKGCGALETVTMKDRVTELGSYAFSDCKALSTIVLSDSLTALNQGLFTGCEGLKEMTLGSKLESIHASVFTTGYLHNYTLRCVNFKGSVNEWNSLTGHDAKVIKDADIYCTDGEIYAVIYSTMYLSAYLKLTGDGTVVIYGKGPFSLDNLGNATLSKFADRAPVKKVIVESGITSLSSDMFRGCEELNEVEFADTLISVHGDCFKGTAWYESLTEPYIANGVLLVTPDGMSGSYTVPENVTRIGAYAFYNQSGLTEIVLHGGIRSIGTWAFFGCTGLTEMILPEGLQEADNYIFENCPGLVSVTVPASLTKVNSLFSSCANLEKIVVLGEKGSERELFRLAGSCEKLTTVIIGDGFTSIDEPFYSCSALSTLIVGSDCTSVTNAIFIYSPDCIIYAMNDSVAEHIGEKNRDKVYIYSENKPVGDGNYWHYDSAGNPVIYQ